MNQKFSTDKPLSASGRFGRLSYLAWLFLSSIIFMVIMGIGAAILVPQLDNPSRGLSFIAIVGLAIFYAAFLYFSIVFMIRRLHDRNHSGWLSLLIFVPAINFVFALYLIFAKGNEGSNSFGPQYITKSWEKILGWCYILLIPVVGILAAISIPAYQNYVERAQQAQQQQLLQQEYNRYQSEQ